MTVVVLLIAGGEREYGSSEKKRNVGQLVFVLVPRGTNTTTGTRFQMREKDCLR